ncbi:MAG TPA: NADH-quinone oxidoreductase subunit NuoF [Thermotogota bacterium]|nr:NADH-quinone oxidoreductase subunit NuoF [Thermotogota bacterium]HPJ88187.1 NADH-quinone oxidoreductase subunit NuoF [Thermotogota bacterium]HPR95620.1 NADH-quinone oxidoreductase subunit NuoF [Thermotogota bacterium]
MPVATNTILMCAGGGCISAGEESCLDALNKAIDKYALQDVVKVVETGCMGMCDAGPLMVIYPEGVYYQKLTPADVDGIVSEHILKGRIVEEKLLDNPLSDVKTQNPYDDHPFFTRQVKIATRNMGIIDPLKIEEYIAHDGYFALQKALSMTPDEVIAEVKASGLRGRGGAGFPTGLKWELTKKVPGDQKYVLCNADEGDPGAFMDRSILEGDPHSLLEAMAIAGYAIGANKGYVYIRAEYPLAIERLNEGIKQAKELGLFGENIMGSGFSFDLEIRMGAGAFVCGEETALIESLEGKRGQPRNKPPFPAQKGVWGMPTLNNNVETYANIPPILTKGSEWFSSIGTEECKGTKVFCLSGKVKNTGLVEVPMGISLREVVYDIGGGIPGGKAFKAVQTGGPSGGCIPADYLDTPITYENLKKLGTMMGSGGMVFMDEDTCMVDVAKYFLDFSVEESCGKCLPCREGNRVMLEILEKITSGEGEEGDLEMLERLGKNIMDTSLCGLGQSSPQPVISTLRYFRDEYEAHIREKRCPAKVCKPLTRYIIDAEKCVGCTACSRVCPVSAIEGAVKQVHEIDPEICTRCGSCVQVCRFGAISKVSP